MICSGCGRDNRANRRYCGACGSNLEPACGGCGFVNDRDDRYCGGCGASMAAEGVAAIAGPAAAGPAPPTHQATARYDTPAASIPPPHPAQAAVHAPAPVHAAAARHRSMTQAVPVVPAWQPEELAGLFTPAAPADTSELPEIGIAQDDLDRLFGAVP